MPSTRKKANAGGRRQVDQLVSDIRKGTKRLTKHPSCEAECVLEDALAAELGHDERDDRPHDLAEDLRVDRVCRERLDRQSGAERCGR